VKLANAQLSWIFVREVVKEIGSANDDFNIFRNLSATKLTPKHLI